MRKLNLFRFSILLLFVFAATLIGCTDDTPRILVFSKTAGFYHESIPTGIEAIQKLGVENGFAVDTTKDAATFTEQELKKYKAVVFLNTTMNVLTADQQVAFERYIQAGGGFVGIHAAADTEYDWPWYNRLVGAYFQSHPSIQAATINVIDTTHLSVKGLPATWERTDEWYNYKSIYAGHAHIG
jgi:cytochrome c